MTCAAPSKVSKWHFLKCLSIHAPLQIIIICCCLSLNGTPARTMVDSCERVWRVWGWFLPLLLLLLYTLPDTMLRVCAEACTHPASQSASHPGNPATPAKSDKSTVTKVKLKKKLKKKKTLHIPQCSCVARASHIFRSVSSIVSAPSASDTTGRTHFSNDNRNHH